MDVLYQQALDMALKDKLEDIDDKLSNALPIWFLEVVMFKSEKWYWRLI